MSTSTSSASGRTMTVAAEVWIRPWDSVTGTRCTRCGPPSCFRRCQASSPLHHEGHLVEAVTIRWVRRQHLEFPAAALGVTAVHLEQVPGEQVGLFAPFGATDLHDDVAAVVGIARQQQQPQLLLQPFSPRPPPVRARRAAARVPRRWPLTASPGPSRRRPRPRAGGGRPRSSSSSSL